MVTENNLKHAWTKGQYLKPLNNTVEDVLNFCDIKGLNESYQGLFREIVSRCAFDAAAITQTANSNSELSYIFRTLSNNLASEDKARETILDNLAGFTHSRVQTPHPTELLSEEGIKAERAFMEGLIATPALFETNGKLSEEEKASIATLAANLREAISKPVQKSLTIEEEMHRAAEMSDRQFESIPLIANDIMSAIHTDSSQLTFEQLKQFGNMVKVGGWSPGDMDSKPLMTVERLKMGLEINEEHAWKRYQTALETLVEDSSGVLPPQQRNAILDIINIIDSPQGSKNPKDFLTALESLREDENIRGIKLHPEDHISAIDSLIIQAMNTGDTAQRVQIRQNKDMHREVLTHLLESDILPASALERLGLPVNQAERGSVEPKEVTERFIEALSTDASFANQVREAVSSKLAIIAAQRKEDTSKADYNFYQTLESMGVATANPDKIPEYIIAECTDKTDIFNAFALLKVMEGIHPSPSGKKVEIVSLSEYPDRVMEENGKIPAVEMVKEALANPYFRQHQDAVSADSNLLAGSDRDHAVTVAEAKRMYGIDPKDGDENRHIATMKTVMFAGSDVTRVGGTAAAMAVQDTIEKTVAAMLDQENPVLVIPYTGTGGSMNRTNIVKSRIRTEQGCEMNQTPKGDAIETEGVLCQYLWERLPRELDLPQEPGSLWEHYKQPSDSLVNSRFLTNPALNAQVNLGDREIFKKNPQMWEEETKDRTYAMIRKYEAMFGSEQQQKDTGHPNEFATYCGYTGSIFVNNTAFAARPAKRVDASAESATGFPPPVDIYKTRAIGYAAMLNTAGSCAPLYYGGSAYLNTGPSCDITPVRNMYLQDPKAQDTINRMTYGIVMADLDTAWQYLGDKKAPDTQCLQDIMRKGLPQPPAYDDQKAPFENALANMDYRKAVARHCLADITLEYNKVANQLLRLHAAVKGRPMPREEIGGKEAARQVLELLPNALKEQLHQSLCHISGPRKQLADLFQEIEAGERTPKSGQAHDDCITRLGSVDRGTQKYDEIVYPAMATLFTCFENAVPAAYKHRGFAEKVQTQTPQLSVA